MNTEILKGRESRYLNIQYLRQTMMSSAMYEVTPVSSLRSAM